MTKKLGRTLRGVLVSACVSALACLSLGGLGGKGSAAFADELEIRRLPGVALTARNKCTTILRISRSGPVKTLLLVAGDIGRYTMEADGELSPPPVWLLMRNKVAVAAINKPGISLSASGLSATKGAATKGATTKAASAKSATQVNDNIFMGYSIGKMVDCWADYLKQLSRQPPAGVTINRVLMLGSGEGAHVMIRLYDRLIKERSSLAQKVKTIYLTGFSIDGAYDKDMPYELGKETWQKLQDVINNKALAKKAKEKAVYELMDRSRGLTWFEDLKAHQNLSGLFDNFRKAGSNIYFNIYQGLDDNMHDIAGFRAWEAANIAAKDAGKPHINAFIRYYTGDYGLNTAASNDLYTSLAWDIIGR